MLAPNRLIELPLIFCGISPSVEPTPTDCQIISIHHNIQDKLKISPVQTSILTQSSVLICLSLLKCHERLPEADTRALLSVLYYLLLLHSNCLYSLRNSFQLYIVTYVYFPGSCRECVERFSLPHSIRAIQTKDTFKSTLKTHLFQRHFSNIHQTLKFLIFLDLCTAGEQPRGNIFSGAGAVSTFCGYRRHNRQTSSLLLLLLCTRHYSNLNRTMAN